MIDIKINSEQGKFKFRVCGILEHNGKYLVLKMNGNDFFCLPGGHVELTEDTEMAVVREMHEELNLEVVPKKLVAINQNFFKTYDNRPFHELGFYYVVKAKDESKINTQNYVFDELDKGKIQHLEFYWFTLEQLKEIDLRPKFIIGAINSENTIINITRD